ncbi:MAG: single-stranded DNA-binding protein [Alphaproteobacteria bacterium]|nr:single-stranded DNA-binding protein [Alphaproteobacteria bacterium]
MRGINKVFIMGNLGNLPELRTTPAGSVVCELSVATNRKFKTQSGDYAEDTEWHRVTCWNQTAEIAHRFLVKGSPVAIEGRLRTESWEDKQTGAKRTKTSIVCEQLHLVGGPRPGAASGASSGASGRHAPVPEEEVPF